jgi:hypothetical protein
MVAVVQEVPAQAQTTWKTVIPTGQQCCAKVVESRQQRLKVSVNEQAPVPCCLVVAIERHVCRAPERPQPARKAIEVGKVGAEIPAVARGERGRRLGKEGDSEHEQDGDQRQELAHTFSSVARHAKSYADIL